jgi:hypothetical protein
MQALFIGMSFDVFDIRSSWHDGAWDACPDEAAWWDGFRAYLAC